MRCQRRNYWRKLATKSWKLLIIVSEHSLVSFTVKCLEFQPKGHRVLFHSNETLTKRVFTEKTQIWILMQFENVHQIERIHVFSTKCQIWSMSRRFLNGSWLAETPAGLRSIWGSSEWAAKTLPSHTQKKTVSNEPIVSKTWLKLNFYVNIQTESRSESRRRIIYKETEVETKFSLNCPFKSLITSG